MLVILNRILVSYFRIATYLPREGPETHHKEKPSLFQQGIYSSLSTSRGDSFIRAKDSKSKIKKRS